MSSKTSSLPVYCIFCNGKYSNSGSCYASIFISATLLPQILWLSHHHSFLLLPVFKIDYFFLPNKAEILPLSLEIWHQITSSEIQMLGKHVVMHLFKTTCITFPIRSAYACTLSLQFPFHNFFSNWIFAFTAEHPCLNGSHSYFILLWPPAHVPESWNVVHLTEPYVTLLVMARM